MENFKLYCEYTKELIDRKKIVLQIINRNYLKLRYEKQFIEKFITEKQVDEKIFKYMLSKELPNYIISIVSDNIDFLIRFTIENEEETNKEELENNIREKLKIVEKTFINAELISSYRLKTTSKIPLLKQVNWEVNEKILDRDHEKARRKKFSILEIQTIGASSGIPLISFPMPFRGADDSDTKLILTLTTEDIDYLIMELNQIKRVIDNE